VDNLIKNLAKKMLSEVEFASIQKEGRFLSFEELKRAVHQMIATEHEAVHLYTQLVDSTDNEMVKKVILDIANEEKVHIGEFLKLLFKLDPKEKDFYKQGFEEVEKIIIGDE
jgi:rubrerythrin